MALEDRLRKLFVLALTTVVVYGNHAGIKSLKRAVNRQTYGISTIPEPHLPNCTEEMCTGPLAGIYCGGKLTHVSWLFGLQDSCPGDMMRHPPDRVLQAFNKLTYPLKKEDFKKFCYDNFVSSPYLQSTELTDWTEEPKNVRLLKNISLRNFTTKLNFIWKSLGREFIPQVMQSPDRFPVLAVPNPFVVPGGLFQVYFYWDSYWIIKGLLFSNMTDTIRNIIENFAYVVQFHGFIPNGGTIQLTRRSQPPLFTQMVADYFEATNNKTFLSQMIPYIDKELSWWRANRSTEVILDDGSNHTVFQYKSITDCPRPENYLIDLNNGFNGTGEPNFIWSSIASACESGLDFSSRWFAYDGKQARSKFSIRTNQIIPVDLNVFMVWNYRSLAKMWNLTGEPEKAKKYEGYATSLRQAIEKILWHGGDGIWYDFDIQKKAHRAEFYPSNVFPLILEDSNPTVTNKILGYLRKNDVLKFPGGIPSALDSSSHEQWDFPNGWAPSIHLFVESLRRSKHPDLVDIGKGVANNFITTVYNGLMKPIEGMPPACWEKYDVRFDDGRPGVGGEYPVQQGFGWTNGAVLDMIYRFHIQSPDSSQSWSSFPLLIRPVRNHRILYILLVFLPLCSLMAWIIYQIRKAGYSHNRTYVSDIIGRPEESHLIEDTDSD